MCIRDRGYVVVNENEINSTRVTVRLRGQRLALDTLSQSSTKVQAIVDLSNVIYSYNGEPVSVPVNIVIPSVVNNSFEILSKSVQSVTVDIQPYINKDFTVKPVVNYSDESSGEPVSYTHLIANIVTAMHESNVESVMCNGEWVMKDRVILTLDEQAILEEAKIHAEAIRKRAGIVLPDRFPVVKC